MSQTLILPNADGYAWIPSEHLITCFMPKRSVKIQYIPEIDVDDFVNDTCSKCPLYFPLDDDEIYYRPYDNTFCAGYLKLYENNEPCPKNKRQEYIQKEDFTPMPHVFAYHVALKEHYLFIAQTDNNSIQLTPYRYGNVYQSGRICWGNNETSIHSLKEDYNMYWETVFTTDLIPATSHFDDWLNKDCINYEDKFYVPLTHIADLVPGGKGTYFCHISDTCTFGKHVNEIDYLWENGRFVPINQPA